MPAPIATGELYIGLMSGTSLDGVDGVLVSLPPQQAPTTLAAAHIPFDAALRDALMALQDSGPDEIHRSALLAQQLARHYAACVAQLRSAADTTIDAISAIGVHGQTIRHRPELGYTQQLNQAALLAELSGIDVIADFRSRDVAAGGQGAPLVPAFHQAVFGHALENRVVLNIGGISNISILPAAAGTLGGFDTGPGNALMDGWIARHRQQAYDDDGAWAASGTIHPGLLQALLAEDYFQKPAPKSTGRDVFHLDWLTQKLAPFGTLPTADVQATLCALTATSIAAAIRTHAPATHAVYVCGGGVYNGALMQQLEQQLAQQFPRSISRLHSTAALGIAPNQVEALAFAWLAQRFTLRLPGNVAAVTGAAGARILGALYPA